MHEDDAISRAWEAQHSDEPDALDGPGTCDCGEPSLSGANGDECCWCREERLADESAEHAIERERERTEAA